jgi:DNA-binding CsgD family transcriptional regulator/pimeloyl-ACP methyl ester carboxylesterase
MGFPAIKQTEHLHVSFNVLGSGPHIAVLFPYHVNHLALNWCVPLHRGAFEYLARSFSVINLDFRGAGASQQSLCSLSLDDLASDLRSVADTLELRRLAVCALGDAALVACRFAAMFPEQVARMVFIAAGPSEMNRRVLSLRRMNPPLEAQMRAALFGGLGDERNAAALAAVAKQAIGSEELDLWCKLLGDSNLAALAATVRSRVLWLHASNDQLVEIGRVRPIVESMPSAELAIVPGKSGMDIWRNQGAMRRMLTFIAEGFDIPLEMARAPRRGLRRHSTDDGGLSNRELDVLRRVAAGQTNKEISQGLFISLNTVSYHLRNIFRKTGAGNRTEAASFAHQMGLYNAVRPAESA